MASNPAPRWQRLEHDERRRQILVVARRLFSERSYAAVSTSDIAREAGVARGLLHHYFGTKRELYLEVVRALVLMPSNPVPLQSGVGGLEVVISESVDRWLEMLGRNRGTWLAAVGAQGLGRDVEIEAILDDAREQAVNRLIAAVEPYGAGPHAAREELPEFDPRRSARRRGCRCAQRENTHGMRSTAARAATAPSAARPS